MFFEAPVISSTSPIRVYSNDQNWVNFSQKPQVAVQAATLARLPDGGAAYVNADATAPHLNQYFLLSEAAANGQCWTCHVNPPPVDMTH